MGDLKFQIQHYATEMWRRKWNILLIGLIVGILGTYFAATRPDVFTSRAAVEVDENALLNAVLPKGAPRTNTQTAIDSVRRGIYARPNLEQIIYDTDLNLTLSDKRGMEKMVMDLEEKLELKRQGQNFYLIEYTHNDPVVARNVTQAALDLFLEKGTAGVASGEGSKKEEARRFLSDKLEVSTGELAAVQRELAVYLRENADAVAGRSAIQDRLRSLDDRLSRLNSDRLLLQGELSNFESRLSATQSEIIIRYEQPVQQVRRQTPPPVRPNVIIPQGPTNEQLRADGYQEQLGQLRIELQTLLERLTPQHPDVIALQTRMNAAERDFAGLQAQAQAANARLQSAIAQANQTITDYENDFRNWQIENSQPVVQQPPRPIYGPNPAIADIRAQVSDRRSRLKVVNTQIAEVEQEKSRNLGISLKQPEIVQAFTRLQTNERKLISEVSRLEEDLSLIEPSNVQAVTMRVIEPPIVPVTPAGPNRLLLFLAAFIMAAGSGMGLAFLRVQLTDNIPTVRHMKQAFDLPILGGVSMIESRADHAKKAAGNLLFLASVAAIITVFGYITYRYHFELWRPDFTGMMAKLDSTSTPRG